MPDQIPSGPPTPPAAPPVSGAKPLEVDVAQQSLRNYEVRTMQDDIASAPSLIVEAPKAAPVPPAPVVPPKPDISSLASKIPPPSPAPAKPAPAKPPVTLPPDLFDEEHDARPLQVKRFLVGFLGILVVGFLGLGAYWYMTSSSPSPVPIASNPKPPSPSPSPHPAPVTTPSPSPTPAPVTTPPVAPAPLTFDSPLIPVNKTLAFKVSAGEGSASFLANLKQAINGESSKIAKGDFVRVYLHTNGKKLTLSELEKLLSQPLPLIKPYLDETSYTIFFEKGDGDTIRFGIVAAMTNRASVENILPGFESVAPKSLGKTYTGYTGSILPALTADQFFDNAYQGIKMRYVNFGSAALTFDYALDNNLFLAVTSRETMFALVDRLKLK